MEDNAWTAERETRRTHGGWKGWLGLAGAVAVVGLLLLPSVNAAPIRSNTLGTPNAFGTQLLRFGVASDSRTTTSYSAAPTLMKAWATLSASAGSGTGAAVVVDDFEFNACASPTVCTSTFVAAKTVYNISIGTAAQNFLLGALNLTVSCNKAGSSAIAVGSLNVEINVTDTRTGASSGWAGLPILPVAANTTGFPLLALQNFPANTYSNSPDWTLSCSGTQGTGYASSQPTGSGYGNFTALGTSTTFLGRLTVGHSYLVQYRFVMIAGAEVYNDPLGGTTAAASVPMAGPLRSLAATTPVTIY
jgi:hypothetical protein